MSLRLVHPTGTGKTKMPEPRDVSWQRIMDQLKAVNNTMKGSSDGTGSN